MDEDGPYEARLRQVRGDLDHLVGRLRSLGTLSWKARRAAVKELLDRIGDLAAQAEHRTPRRVPDLPDHALADALVVLGADLISALAIATEPDVLDAAGRAIDAALAATR